MGDAGLVLLTENLLDYVLAAAARRKLATLQSVPACYPVFAPAEPAPEQKLFLARHGCSARWFSELVGGTDSVARSRELSCILPWTGGAGISVPADAPVALLLGALLQSFAQDRALILENAPAKRGSWPLRLGTGETRRLVVARSASEMAIAAAVYAEATGKTFIALPTLDAVEQQLEELRPDSVILADDLDRFSKAFLARLLEWSQQGPVAPVLLGIMAGQSFAQLSALIGRQLVHRDFRERGGRLFEPPVPEPIAVQNMEPMEFYILTAHGNEMHLRHDQDEIICGAFAHRTETAENFNCEPQCPHHKRVRASAVPTQAVFLLSCDAFTLANGLVPPEFNVMLNFLNGWASVALAPFKHVQGNLGLRVLTNALVRSGYSIGEVAQRLNSVARLDDVPDYSYLVLGDPDVVVRSEGARCSPPVAVQHSSAGLAVACDALEAPAVEIDLDVEHSGDLFAANVPQLALEPLSTNLQRPDIYFAMRWLPNRKALSIIIFGKQALPGDPLIFRLVPTCSLDEHGRQAALSHLKRMARLRCLDFLGPTIRRAEDQVLSILRAVLAYPRAVELMQGHAVLRGITPILMSEFREARQEILRAILGEMASKRVWISQIYSAAYPLVRQVKPAHRAGCCHCGNGLTNWSYQDGCTDLPDRVVTICDRCGIIEDRPAAAGLEIKLATCQLLAADTHRQVFSLHNTSSRAIELSLLHQFNQWQSLGIKVDPAIEDLVLEAGEQVQKEILFRFPADLPDDMQHMQFFALTDHFDIHFVGQKFKSMIRGERKVDIRRKKGAAEQSVRAD